MKFNIGKRKSPYLVFLAIIIAAIGGLIYYQFFPHEITRYNFYGAELQFRDDLRSANNVSIYPDKESILNKLWDPDIYKVNIAYVPTPDASDENSILSLNAFEIRYKLDIAYQQFNWVNEFTSTELESFENISHDNNTLVVALVRPSLSDKTAVEMDGNVIYIKGKTAEDFDRATIKFLMAALNITA